MKIYLIAILFLLEFLSLPSSQALERIVIPVQREKHTSYADATPQKNVFSSMHFENFEWALGFSKAQLNLKNVPSTFSANGRPQFSLTGQSENLFTEYGDYVKLRGLLSGYFQSLSRKTEISLLGQTSMDQQSIYFLSLETGFELNLSLGSERNTLFASGCLGPIEGLSSRSKLADADSFSGFRLRSNLGYQRFISKNGKSLFRLSVQRALTLLDEGNFSSSGLMAGFIFHF